MRFRFYVLLVIFLMLLEGCSHQGRQDGPPNYNVDVSSIPDAVPRAEARSRYGNYPSYVVFGKRYYTMRNGNHYDQVGTASWYGTKFHAHKTSSGEQYNMLGMTAAHKTLPLPTYVEVTNLANNRKVIVKVNDRGPFATNRIIDLSYVAAKKLGMLAHGTARVRVKSINPYTHEQQAFFTPSGSTRQSPAQNNLVREKTYPAFHPLPQHGRAIFLQVGAFRDRNRALKLQRHLNRILSSNAQVEMTRDKFYKVKIGPIRNTAVQQRITHQLKELGITPT